MIQSNYLVTINGRYNFPAESEAEVWEIIGRYPIGSLYMVGSPAGLPVGQFIPF